MRRLIRSHHAGYLALLLLVPMFALAAEPATATEASTAASRFKLKSSSTEAAPQQSNRFTLRARFTPVASAGELREGEDFTLISRFAKTGVSCGTGGSIFTNGFEGNP